jgi:DNA mismatch repair protein MutS
VARLAGLPQSVLARATEVLARLESGASEENADSTGLDAPSPPTPDPTLPAPHPILEEVRQMDLFGMTPLEAMNKLAEIKDRLEKETDS